MSAIYDNLDPATNPIACAVRDNMKNEITKLREQLAAAEAKILHLTQPKES